MTTNIELPYHQEEWRFAPGTYGWYEVSSLGRIRSWVAPGPRLSFGRPRPRVKPLLLNPTVGKRGYRVWCHRLDGKEERLTVHRTVCEAFHGAPPEHLGPRPEVRHLDGDKLNNVATNLAWGSAAENAADRVRHGTSLSGERNPFARLTEGDVATIRALVGIGWWGTIDETAAHYGVSRQTIRRIVRRETWKAVS